MNDVININRSEAKPQVFLQRDGKPKASRKDSGIASCCAICERIGERTWQILF
jgi:hypothetical protein